MITKRNKKVFKGGKIVEAEIMEGLYLAYTRVPPPPFSHPP